MQKRWLILFLIILTAFVCGYTIGVKQIDVKVLAQRVGITKKIPPRNQLHKKVYNEPIYDGQLKHDAILDLNSINKFLENDLVKLENFDQVLDRIIIITDKQHYVEYRGDSLPVIEIKFEFLGKDYVANVYGKPSDNISKGKYGTLIIPGSGMNQSSAIFNKEKTNYHDGIFEALQPLNSDVFIFVKPNEDFLAYHDGSGRKLNTNAIINYHLNRNSSYSALYLLQAFAFTKWFGSLYDKTAIAGLSQGGAATIFLAVNFNPDIAVVSSGYTRLMKGVNISGFDQILGVPGFIELLDEDYLRGKICNSKTEYIFSWGEAEEDYYGVESTERISASIIEDLKNVKIIIHEKGHIFPVEEIKGLLYNITN